MISSLNDVVDEKSSKANTATNANANNAANTTSTYAPAFTTAINTTNTAYPDVEVLSYDFLKPRADTIACRILSANIEHELFRILPLFSIITQYVHTEHKPRNPKVYLVSRKGKAVMMLSDRFHAFVDTSAGLRYSVPSHRTLVNSAVNDAPHESLFLRTGSHVICIAYGYKQRSLDYPLVVDGKRFVLDPSLFQTGLQPIKPCHITEQSAVTPRTWEYSSILERQIRAREDSIYQQCADDGNNFAPVLAAMMGRVVRKGIGMDDPRVSELIEETQRRAGFSREQVRSLLGLRPFFPVVDNPVNAAGIARTATTDAVSTTRSHHD